MKAIIAIGFVICIFWVGCQKTREDVAVLPSDEVLIPLFVDLHLAEMPMGRVPEAMRDSIGGVLRERIAVKYDMSSEELQDVVAALQLDPTRFIAVYDSVVVRLEEMRQIKEKK